MTDEQTPRPASHTADCGTEGCAESRLLMSRRGMLGLTAGLFSWAFVPRFAEAASAGADPRLLVVVLRGGMDGLSTVVPHGDPHYAGMRRDIAIPAASTIPLTSSFGLHPAMPHFGALFRAREAAVVHATCTPLRNRSHFDAQDNLENGLPGLAANATGWLNRLLTALPAGAPIRSKGAIQIGDAPLILRGPAPVLGWSPTWFQHLGNPTLQSIRALYRTEDQEMLSFLDLGIRADRLAEGVAEDDGDIGELRKGFRGAARLLGSSSGPRMAVLSVGGWDTHDDQGVTTGQMANVLGQLDLGLKDFQTNAGAAWGQTVVLMVTEFGRTVRVNGGRGTDHGVGTVALLAGGSVNGGRVFGDWPGLAPANLYEDSDLKPTTDLRSVFKGVLGDHLGVPRTLLDGAIFPESARTLAMRGLVKTGAPAAAALASVASAEAGGAPARLEPPIARYRRGQTVSMARGL